MTLHIVNQSPYSSSALDECLHAFAEGDALLLIENGVYAATAAMRKKFSAQTVYCLAADMQARGLSAPDHMQMIDDAQWVQLCCDHSPIVSWFK